MARVEPSQTGQTAPQCCPVNLNWDLHKKLKDFIPGEEQERAFNLFQVTKPPPDPPRTQEPIPIPISPRLAPGSRAHLHNGGDAQEQTHLPNGAHLSAQTAGSPPTSMGLASVATPKPATRASAGKRISTATSKSNLRRDEGVGGDGIEARGPLPSLPHPVVPSHQAVSPTHLRRSSNLAHRSQRTRARTRDDDGPMDLDSCLRRLAPREGSFGRRSIQTKLRILDDKLKQVKAIEEALAQRRTHASSRASDTKTADYTFAPQCGLTMGSEPNGAPWTGLQHFSITPVYPTFSECQRHYGFLAAQGFGSEYGQRNPGNTASPSSPIVQDQRPLYIPSVDAWKVPASGPSSRHNACVSVSVEMGATPVQPTPRHQVHAHATVDGGVVTATSLFTSHGNPAPSFYPGQAGFGRQGNVVRAGTLSVCPVSESATVQPATGSTRRGSLGKIFDAGTLEAECFFDEARVVPCGAPVVNVGLELQPDYEGTYHVPLPSHAPHPPEPRWDSLSSASLPTSIPDSGSIIAPFEGPRMRVSTYSSLDGAVSASTASVFTTHISYPF